MSRTQTYSTVQQTKSKRGYEASPGSNIYTLTDTKNKFSYEDLQSIATTAVDTLSTIRDRCMSAEAKNEVLEKMLNEAQDAIESRDLIINKYEPREIDENFMTKLDELKGFMSDDPRFEEIRRKKYEDMKSKQEQILRNKYNFSKRF